MSNATPIYDRKIPCALRRHVYDRPYGKRIVSPLTPYGCQQIFLYWVENYRELDPYKEEVELRTCPMLWCRKTFESEELRIRHLRDCPRLPNAWYWCPSHRCPERFLECTKLCESVPEFSFRYKDYKLHLPELFNKWIRPRCSSKSPTKKEQAKKAKALRYRSHSRGDLSAAELPDSEKTFKPSTSRSGAELFGGIPPIELDNLTESGLTCNPSASRQERNDSSYPPEIGVALTFPQHASTELLQPIHGKPGQCSLRTKIHTFPAIDHRCSTATQSQNVRDRGSLYHSAPARYAVSSKHSRHSRHDSSGSSTDSNQMENLVRSSPRPPPLDCNKNLPASPQRKSLNLDRSLPPTPGSATTQISPTMISPSNHFLGTNYVHRMSSEPSVFHSDSKTSPDTDMAMLPYQIRSVHETDRQPNNQRELCLTNSSVSSSIEIMNNRGPAENLSAEDQNHPGESKDPNAFWNTIHLSTPTSTTASLSPDVLPSCPPGFGPSLSLSEMFPPTDSTPNSDFPTSSVVPPVSVIDKVPDLDIMEHYEAGAGNWVSLNSWPLEPTTKTINHRRSRFQNTSSALPNQFQVSNGANSSTFGAQWVRHDVATVPYLQRKESFDLSDSIYLNGIEECLESDIQSSMINSIMTRLGTSKTSNPVFLPPMSPHVPLTLDIHKDSSFTDGNVQTVIADALVPTLSPFEMNDHDQNLGILSSPVNVSGQRSRYSAPLDMSQTKDLPLSCPMNDMFFMDNGTMEAKTSSPNLEATDTYPGLSRKLAHCPIKGGHRITDNVFDAKGIFASPQGSLFRLYNVLGIHSSTKRQPHCFEHGTLLVSHSPSEETLFGELRGLIGVVNSDWMDKLSSVPHLWQRSKVLSPDALLKNGIYTLKGLLCGRLAQTFEELFALFHLAFASAFFLHRQQGFFCWDIFYNDAFQWQHTLANDEDRVVFLEVMKPELWPVPPLYRNRLNSLYDVISREWAYCGDCTSLLGVLRTNELLKVCIGFLDCLEEAGIGERNLRFPLEELAMFAQSRPRKVQHMINTITLPIQRERGIEALRSIVSDTELLIDRGLLQECREVEVTLLTSGRRSSESPEVLERFHALVTSQCDEAMHSWGLDGQPDWRTDHYISGLNKLLELLERSARQQSNDFTTEHWTHTNVLTAARRKGTMLDPPISISVPCDQAGSLDSSPTSLISGTCTESSQTADSSSPNTSPATMSQDSTSPGSQTPDTPVSCKACNLKFTGSPQDAKSNLQRHLRTAKRHNNKKTGLKCPMPECRDKPRMRCDNLSPHLLKTHKINSSVERRAIVQNCRASLERLENNGIS